MVPLLSVFLFLGQVRADWLFSVDPQRVCRVRVVGDQFSVNVTQIADGASQELLRLNISRDYCAPQACLATTQGMALLCANFTEHLALHLVYAKHPPKKLPFQAHLARYDSVYGQLALLNADGLCRRHWYMNTSLGPCRPLTRIPDLRLLDIQDLHVYADRIWLLASGIVYRLRADRLQPLIYTGTRTFPFQFHANHVSLRDGEASTEAPTISVDKWAFPLLSLIELLCLLVVAYRCRCDLFRKGGGVSISSADPKTIMSQVRLQTFLDCVVNEARRRNISEFWLLNGTSWFNEMTAKHRMYGLTPDGHLDQIESPLLIPCSPQQLLTVGDENTFVQMLNYFEREGQPIRGKAKQMPVIGQRQNTHSNNYFFFALSHVLVLMESVAAEEPPAKEERQPLASVENKPDEQLI